MVIIDKHMAGFEKEEALRKVWKHSDVNKRLYMWSDFMAVMRVANPNLCEGVFERRECRRRLRFIGDEGNERDFLLGQVYESVDFNGATYTMKSGRVIGCVYWEVVE